MYICIFGILGPICFTQYGLGMGMQGGLVEVTPGYTIPVNPFRIVWETPAKSLKIDKSPAAGESLASGRQKPPA